MFNTVREVRARFVLAGEAVEDPGSLVVRIGSMLLMGSSVGMLTRHRQSVTPRTLSTH